RQLRRDLAHVGVVDVVVPAGEQGEFVAEVLRGLDAADDVARAEADGGVLGEGVDSGLRGVGHACGSSPSSALTRAASCAGTIAFGGAGVASGRNWRPSGHASNSFVSV